MYTGESCENCSRVRVELIDGRKICEKCNWNQETSEYDDYVRVQIENKMERDYEKNMLGL